jgi:hypothetical protein
MSLFILILSENKTPKPDFTFIEKSYLAAVGAAAPSFWLAISIGSTTWELIPSKRFTPTLAKMYWVIILLSFMMSSMDRSTVCIPLWTACCDSSPLVEPLLYSAASMPLILLSCQSTGFTFYYLPQFSDGVSLLEWLPSLLSPSCSSDYLSHPNPFHNVLH